MLDTNEGAPQLGQLYINGSIGLVAGVGEYLTDKIVSPRPIIIESIVASNQNDLLLRDSAIFLVIYIH